MKNRIVSLFQLDELFTPRRNGNGHAAPAKRKTKKRKAAAKACPPATSTPARAAKTPVTSVQQGLSASFDTGAPIRCDHAVDYPPVRPVDLPSGEPVAASYAESLDIHVEAFEDEETSVYEPTVLLSTDVERAESESQGWHDGGYHSAFDASDGSTPEESTQGEDVPPTSPEEAEARQPSALAAERELPAAFAAQMQAVEADLAELAARADHPAPNAPTPPAPDDQAPTAPPRPTGGGSNPKGHEVFDAMSKGMGYATEFKLPPVQLSQVFSALDRQLDADDASRSAAPTAVSNAPGAPTMPAGDVLLKDLVNIAPPAKPVADAISPQAATPPDAATEPGTNA